MLITYPYRNILSACAAGFVGLEGRHARPGPATVAAAGRGLAGQRADTTATHSDTAPLVWRVPEGRRARLRCRWAVAGHGCGTHGGRRHRRHPHFARNLSWSFFETPQKRCNSNEANSMFERVREELRAKLLIDSHS